METHQCSFNKVKSANNIRMGLSVILYYCVTTDIQVQVFSICLEDSLSPYFTIIPLLVLILS